MSCGAWAKPPIFRSAIHLFSMHYLPLPRRFRCPLLFPPGLLALAWLLCPGCAALPQMRGVGPKQTAMQIVLLPTHTNEFWRFDPPAYSSELQLEGFRRWQTTFFTGNEWHDLFSRWAIRANTLALEADTSYLLGCRIVFKPMAHYGDLVSAIDFVNSTNIKTYWIDAQHEPTVLYVFKRPLRYSTSSIVSCGGVGAVEHIIDNPPQPSKFSDLFSPDWRTSTLLLLLMSLLSLWKLRRSM